MVPTDTSELLQSLWQAGLTEAVLKEAVLRGERARDSATPLDPPGRAGFDAWAETTRTLREQLLPYGWRPKDDQNLSVALSPDSRHALLVVAGDRSTGFDGDVPPQPRRPRGDATLFALKRSQLSLFPDEDNRRRESGPLLWFLMVHRVAGEARLELSLPEAIDDEGFVTVWRERHCLGSVQVTRQRSTRKWRPPTAREAARVRRSMRNEPLPLFPTQ